MQTPKPYQLLHGHDKSITCVAIATELDMAVSGSQVSFFFSISLANSNAEKCSKKSKGSFL